jgi:hypothetical protein
MAEVQSDKAQLPPTSDQTMDQDEWHDLLPIEIKLISYSLGLGIILLVVFIFAFGVFK